MKNLLSLFFISIVLLLNGCKDPKVNPTPPKQDAGFFVINEGGFNHGNASLGHYNPEDNTYTDKLFKAANDRVLGDVFQSFYFHQDKAFAILNNSGYIEVMDTATFAEIDKIEGFNSPRNMLFIDDDKAYVSDLYANAISIVNLSSNTIAGTIPIPSWTEGMTMVSGKVFVVAPWDTRTRLKNQIYIIDPQTDMLTDSITVGYDPIDIALDKQNNLWVYCRGSEDNNAYGGLYLIDPQTQSVKKNLPFSDYESGISCKLAFNKSKDTLYFLKKDIYRLPINSIVLPDNPIVFLEGKNSYGLGIYPENGDIVVSDAKDFVQKGTVFIYDSGGHLKTSFSAGVIPSGFVFME